MATAPALPKAESAGFADALWPEAGWLPCRLSVQIAVPGFTVRDLLRLDVHSILDAHSPSSADVPLDVNGRLIGWAEFEVVGDRLAVRLTELA